MTTDPSHYHFTLDDAARVVMETTAFNFYHHTGRKMQIPPRLYEDLKNAGVDLSYVEVSLTLGDSYGAPGND